MRSAGTPQGEAVPSREKTLYELLELAGCEIQRVLVGPRRFEFSGHC